MDKITNLQIFSSTIYDGNMNTNPAFFEPGLSKQQIQRRFYQQRMQLGKRYGFHGMNILVPTQKSFPNLDGLNREEQEEAMRKYESQYEDGHYIRITKDKIENVYDLYNCNISADILMIGSELPRIVLAYPVADCPVVFVEDTKKQVVSMAHCGGEYIDRGLPGQIVDSLMEEVDSRPNDLRVVIGPHIHKENYIYDQFPKYIRHESVWDGCLTEIHGAIHIDMTEAIINQMKNRGVSLEQIESSPIDPYLDSRYYSHRASCVLGREEGRFYTGCFYSNDEKVLRK